MADIFWKEKLDALNGDVDADGDPKQPLQHRQNDDQSTIYLFGDDVGHLGSVNNYLDSLS